MKHLVLIFSLLSLASSPLAEANVGDTFGFGSRTGALAGAGAAWGFEGYATYSNPAALALPKTERLTLSYGLLAMQPSFTEIQNVVIENDVTSDRVRRGDVDTSYRGTVGQSIGLIYLMTPPREKPLNFSLGVTAYLPLNHLAAFDTGESYVPEYFLYRSRTQRPQIDVGLGVSRHTESRTASLGFGVHLGYSLTANGTLFLQGDSSRVSTMRFSSSIKPKASPYFGALYASNDGAFTTGLVFRLPLNSASTMVLNSGARLFGDLAALDFNFKATSALYYDPMSLELGGSWKYNSRGRLLAQFDFQAWNLFEAPSLYINDPEVTGCSDSGAGSCSGGLEIASSADGQFQFRNILIPRLATEYELPGYRVIRLGYAYRQSILRNDLSGAGNYLDPSKHILTAGLGFRFDRFLSFDQPFTLDLHASWQQLISQSVEKAPGDENGQGTGDLKIGAPGYEVGGKIFGGGLSLSLAL